MQHFLINAEKRIDTHAALQYLLYFLFAFRINRKTFTFAKSLQTNGGPKAADTIRRGLLLSLLCGSVRAQLGVFPCHAFDLDVCAAYGVIHRLGASG